MRRLIIVFALGLVIGSGLCGALAYTIIYRPCAARIGQLGGQLEQAERNNRQLGEQLIAAETMVSKLGAELERNESFVAGAKSELKSSKSSVQKIRAILERLRDLERGAGGVAGD